MFRVGFRARRLRIFSELVRSLDAAHLMPPTENGMLRDRYCRVSALLHSGTWSGEMPIVPGAFSPVRMLQLSVTAFSPEPTKPPSGI